MTQTDLNTAINNCLTTLGKNRKIHIEGKSIRGNKQLSRAESGAVDLLRRNGFVVTLASGDDKKPTKEETPHPPIAA